MRLGPTRKLYDTTNNGMVGGRRAYIVFRSERGLERRDGSAAARQGRKPTSAPTAGDAQTAFVPGHYPRRPLSLRAVRPPPPPPVCERRSRRRKRCGESKRDGRAVILAHARRAGRCGRAGGERRASVE
jgi:hypothetical protein